MPPYHATAMPVWQFAIFTAATPPAPCGAARDTYTDIVISSSAYDDLPQLSPPRLKPLGALYRAASAQIFSPYRTPTPCLSSLHTSFVALRPSPTGHA